MADDQRTPRVSVLYYVGIVQPFQFLAFQFVQKLYITFYRSSVTEVTVTQYVMGYLYLNILSVIIFGIQGFRD